MDGAAKELQLRIYLRRYAGVRIFVVATLALTAFATWEFLRIRIPLVPLVGTIVLLALLNAAVYLRLRRPAPVTEREFFVNALVDIAGITVLLYFTGGGQNPLSSGYLLLVLYAAAVLPRRHCWALAAICVVCYSALQFVYVPLPLPDTAGTHASLDEWGRWVLYVLLAGLVAWFGVHLKELRSEYLSHVRLQSEEEARERYLLGLATLAAGTAHEMGTPLSTMSFVVGDLRRSPKPPPDWKESVDVLWQQIQLCKHSLQDLAHASDLEQLGRRQVVSVREFVQGVAERFQMLRPRVPLTLRDEVTDEALALHVDDTLRQALLSVMSNAADASPEAVELHASAAEGTLTLRILDRGPGIAPQLRERLGNRPVGPRHGGHGLGLLIATSAIERLGGSLVLQDREGGGTCVQVDLPVLKPGTPASARSYEEARVVS